MIFGWTNLQNLLNGIYQKQCKIFIDIEGATKIHLTSISAAIAHINYIRFLIVDSAV